MIALARLSVDFVEFEGGVDGEVGIANGGARGCRPMARRSREIASRTVHCVGIAVALGAGNGNRLGGDELVERSAMAVGGDVAVFRIGNLQEVHSNARQADGLRGSGALIC